MEKDIAQTGAFGHRIKDVRDSDLHEVLTYWNFTMMERYEMNRIQEAKIKK